MKLESVGSVGSIESTSACVVYDGKTGRVAHIHHMLLFHGAAPLSKEQIEATALKMAERHERSAELRILHVPAEHLDAKDEYHVDVLSQQLVPIVSGVSNPKGERPA
jgi:hypothetical protein